MHPDGDFDGDGDGDGKGKKDWDGKGPKRRGRGKGKHFRCEGPDDMSVECVNAYYTKLAENNE